MRVVFLYFALSYHLHLRALLAGSWHMVEAGGGEMVEGSMHAVVKGERGGERSMGMHLPIKISTLQPNISSTYYFPT